MSTSSGISWYLEMLRSAGRVARVFWRLRHWLRTPDAFFHTPRLDGPLAVGRTEYLVELCRGKRVLHFGFADAPFTAERVRSNALLHLRLRAVASSCFGSDYDEQAVREYRTLTDDTDNIAADIEGDLSQELLAREVDVVILGEVLEHLNNPGLALSNLRMICTAHQAVLCITVPNAFNVGGFLAALSGNEIVHSEHHFYFSPVTLRRLLEDNGFSRIEVLLVGGGNTADSPGLTQPGIIALARV